MNLNTFLLAMVLVLSSLALKAAPYGDYDEYRDIDGNATTILQGTSLVDFFQIDADDADGNPDETGYNPTTQFLINAGAFFEFQTALGDTTTVRILLGSEALEPSGSAVVSFLFGSVIGNALIDLTADGILQYQITAQTGDLKLLSATLLANSGDRTPPVPTPDGGMTVVLMSIGFATLGWMRRRIVG